MVGASAPPAGSKRASLADTGVFPLTSLHVLKRWAAWLAGGIAVVVLALVVAWVLFVPAADWLAHHDVGSVKGPLLQTARDAARGRLLTLGAGLFAAGALVFTARNFTLSRRTFELTEQGQVTDRYTKAITQLGSKKLDVRIGGIYALERVARDSARDHPTVMEVLTAFIREHSRERRPAPDPDSRVQERFIRPDVQAAVTVVGRRRLDAKRDLRPIDLARADLTGASLTRARLTRAILTDANLTRADLTRASLRAANLAGADLAGAQLGGTDLREADLADADLAGAPLKGALLSDANLTGADLTGAQLGGAFLFGAHLRGAHLGGADLVDADLFGADLTGADLTGADLTGARWRADVPAPPGWKLGSKLDTYSGSGQLVAAGTAAGPAESN